MVIRPAAIAPSQRPKARGDEVIGMLRRGVCFAHGLGLGSVNLRKLAAIGALRTAVGGAVSGARNIV